MSLLPTPLAMGVAVRTRVADQGESARLHFPAESAIAHRRRLRRLAELDRLLSAVEEENLLGEGPERAAPLYLVIAYYELGGSVCWEADRPSGAELHEAVLLLEETAMRPPAAPDGAGVPA